MTRKLEHAVAELRGSMIRCITAGVSASEIYATAFQEVYRYSCGPLRAAGEGEKKANPVAGLKRKGSSERLLEALRQVDEITQGVEFK